MTALVAGRGKRADLPLRPRAAETKPVTVIKPFREAVGVRGLGHAKGEVAILGAFRKETPAAAARSATSAAIVTEKPLLFPPSLVGKGPNQSDRLRCKAAARDQIGGQRRARSGPIDIDPGLRRRERRTK
ncbi:hypothetical protein [Sphingopyxis macrogoltabida]|uniref:hypothetical protein n=1 Tax=Sphingopyxis macrogoltabida TaxID=33050 RepID=UPI0013143785|nr:hypothetical protein [Sphingopyxis macrogoltabida]